MTNILSKKVSKLVPIILDKYNNKISGDKIASELNLNVKTVYRVLKIHNIEMISPSIRRRVYQVNDNYFETIDIPEKAYWLGFLMADGCVNDHHQIIINLKIDDIDHLHKFNKSIDSNYVIYNRGHYASINVSSKKMMNDLIKHNVIQRKSLIAKPPKLDTNLMKHFWRGVIDGDGCITTRKSGPQKGMCRLTLVGSKDIVYGFNDFCSEIIDNKSTPRLTGKFYRVEFSGKKAKKIIADLKYNDYLCLNRKWNDS